ncbi:MAG TPA: chloride channel protein [Thermoanaerobaculales bacterium]|nr:chloride channel protein [Thermoanaerobaculales bacterium]HPA80495.1 chloride channel protein [Thermoanaerobaculales bacterium]HQL29778.1 chloride channel protein [Thermoanaerobaculales bacterium]HQN97098.1 chloride channel protein [Thermoanaerobaculales bacterium]HQP42359.1 chloride channel protein [Thermoanaerobaculales bacterium]
MDSLPRAWLDSIARFATRVDLYNFGRWLILACLIGVVAGLGAALLTWGVDGVESALQHRAVGFRPPSHGTHAGPWHPPERPWLLLLVLPAAGLLVGWIVQTFAPEAEGHGTDAVINAYHQKGALLRRRVAPVKLVASAVTIGSGGSAGREGPVAQIGAGFASYLSELIRLPVADRRVLVITGMAAGIGGMFRAPLGAALFAVEVLYSENEYESEALIPAIISSIVAFVVNAMLTGWEPIFAASVDRFVKPQELVAYLVLAAFLAVAGWAYVKTFRGMRDHVFRPMPVPRMVKPAIGALAVALIALGLPQVMGSGYGWIQLMIGGQLPLLLLLLLVPAKILATSCTITSGGSGGVFAPSLVIGGVCGAVFASVAAQVAPALAPPAAACVLVGMGGFFSGVAKVPIASLIMVAEMSGSYTLLVPMMLVSSVSFLLTRGVSIYDSQVPRRVDSPAHIGEFEVDVLEGLTVRDVADLGQRVTTVAPGTPFVEVLEIVASTEQHLFPVTGDDGVVEGIFSVTDVRRVMATPEVWPLLVASDLSVSAAAMAYVELDDDLHTAVRRFSAFKHEHLPVLAGPPPSAVVAILGHQRVLKAYDDEVERRRPPEPD